MATRIGPEAWTPVGERKLSRLFAYLTKIGIAPKFGSMPIGYYQQEQCAAIDELEERAVKAGIIADPKADTFEVRLSDGIVEGRAPVRRARWRRLGSLYEIRSAVGTRLRRFYER